MVAKTFYGLEEVLARELKELGAENIELQNRAISFTGDQALLYRSNLCLRSALRILKPLQKFTSRNEWDLYNGAQKIDWSRYCDADSTIAVSAVVNSPHFTHSQYVSQKIKDAVVDQFRTLCGRRPSVDVLNPTLRLHVYISDETCTLSLDSSGDSLHKRGYRLEGRDAPLNEALAAGLILLTGWHGQSNFIDPMCGSGTLVIEAAMIAYNIPPGLNRDFGFMRWKDFDGQLWERVRQNASEKIADFKHQIIGSDISREAIALARKTLERAHLSGKINLAVTPFETQRPPSSGGVLVMNPPYGERMKKADIVEFYKMIGDHLKQHYTGYDAWILSANREAIKHLGLRPSKTVTVFNGGLECKFQKFTLYKGSRKSKYQTL